MYCGSANHGSCCCSSKRDAHKRALRSPPAHELIKRPLVVADVLDLAAARPSDQVAEAWRIASEIKHEAGEPEINTGPLKQLLMSALTAGSTTLREVAATDLLHLTSQALQTLWSFRRKRLATLIQSPTLR